MIVAAESRIIGRCPNFAKLEQQIEGEFGTDGGQVVKVLEKYCPPRKLKFKKVDLTGCINALKSGRAVAASFFLDENQWKHFSNFYRENPRGVLDNMIERTVGQE